MRRLAILCLSLLLVVFAWASTVMAGQESAVSSRDYFTTRFPTNTPMGGELTQTALPAPTEEAPVNTPTPVFTATESLPPTATTNALVTPTVLYPLNPEEGAVAGGTAIPTRMPLFIPRDREGSEYEVINFLLLGHDSASIDQVNGVFRTDTMIIVSVNLTTQTVSMLSLPRDLYVYIPEWTMQRLNLAWGRGESVGWTDGGFGLLRQTILYNFGIRIHYYAMVDFDGFKEVINRLGGVTIAVDCPIQDYRFTGNYDENDEPIFEFITLPVGVHDMDSTTALFYARSRKNSSDFDRGRRQQQLLRAIWYKAKQEGYLTDIPTLYDDLTSISETNIPLEVMIQLAPLALSMEPNEVENHFFRLGFETLSWTAPDGANVQIPQLGIINTIQAFLIPPTQNRLVSDPATIAIYDNTNLDMGWDVVAAERLIWEGMIPSPSGDVQPPEEWRDHTDTILIDYTGETKGSNVDVIARLLNIKPANIVPMPDPNRTVDIAVYLSDNYSSCVDRDVVEPVATTPTTTP